MNKTKFLLRVGFCIIIVGVTILFANVTVSQRGYTSPGNFRTSPNGTDVRLVTLRNRPYEIRISVPKAFRGTFYLLNYEGIRELIEGTKTPILEETIKGSTLIDYTPTRRGAYLILIESHVSTQTEGSIGLVEKEALSQDMMLDSTIIIIFGFTLTMIAVLTKMKKSQNAREYV